MTPARTADRVVIAGAGPVGLLLACELARARVPVVVVERLARPMTESRASQLTTLTAELLHERGFGELLAEAAHEPRSHFAGLGFDLSGLDSEYAGNWKVPQYRTERVLGERAEADGVTLLRAHELTEVVELPDRVVCGVDTPDGHRRIEGRYVVGCDGARSTVRRLCGFPVSAAKASRELLRADVTGIRIRDRRFERLPAGFAVAATRDGVTRVMVHAFGRAPAERTGPPDFAEIARLWAEVTGEDITGGTAIWRDAFDNSRGQARAYRLGRVLLAGDAAHWHLPIGGQALNIGLQDAVDLGWKLAGTMNGWAAPGLLDAYHADRHPAAARVLDHVAAQEALLLGGAEAEPVRAVLSELAGLAEVGNHLARVAANLDVRYGPDGPWPTGRRAANLPARARRGRPPAARPAAQPVVVRFKPPPGGRDRLPVPTVHAPGEAGSFPGIGALLLRPDGYVAWAGDAEDDLDEAIGRLVRVEGGRTEDRHADDGQADGRQVDGRRREGGRGNARV